MNIIAVDDKPSDLRNLEQSVKKAAPDCTLYIFFSPNDALSHAKKAVTDIAILNAEMDEMTGISLATQLKRINPKINIIFAADNPAYADSAFAIHASGYILKPVTPEAIIKEIQNLRYPIILPQTHRVKVRCFGNFDVFLDGKPLSFSRAKAKELLAYLVDRKGASVTVAEICSILWEDKEYNRSMQKQTQTVISLLMKALREAGIEYIVIKRWNSVAIDTEKINCDYYNFLDGDASALNTHMGEYMRNYSWAETTTGMIFG